jgi:hypothetical protein
MVGVIIPIPLQSTGCIKLQESALSHAQKLKGKKKSFLTYQRHIIAESQKMDA